MTTDNPFAGLALDTERAFKILIMQPDGETPLRDEKNTQAWATVVSGDSKIASRARSEARAYVQELHDTNKMPEGIEADALRSLVVASRCVTGWYLLSFNGKPVMDVDGTTPIPCTPDNALKLFLMGDGVAWLYQQIVRPVYARENFTPAP